MGGVMDQLLTEEQIRQIEAEALYQYYIGKAEAPKLYKPYGELVKAEDADAEDGSGTFTFVANEESEDRMGDIIMVNGWQLGNFKSNNVIMWAHNYGEPPVGNAPRVWKSTGATSKANGGNVKQLLNTVVFDMEDPQSAMIAGKVARKVLKAESVGFRPLEFEAKDEDDQSFFAPLRFLKQDLLEISIVPIPAHPRALAKTLAEAVATNKTFNIPDSPKIWSPPDTGSGQATAGYAQVKGEPQGVATVATGTVDLQLQDHTRAFEDFDAHVADITERVERLEAINNSRSVADPEPDPEPLAVDPPAPEDIDADEIMRALTALREESM